WFRRYPCCRDLRSVSGCDRKTPCTRRCGSDSGRTLNQHDQQDCVRGCRRELLCTSRDTRVGNCGIGGVGWRAVCFSRQLTDPQDYRSGRESTTTAREAWSQFRSWAAMIWEVSSHSASSYAQGQTSPPRIQAVALSSSW